MTTNKTKINPDHQHAVAHIEQDFGKKIKHLVKTYATESAAVRAVKNGNKGTFPTRILSGQAYAKKVNGEWVLGQESRDWNSEQS